MVVDHVLILQAMTFVFGNTFVCKDAATAKIVRVRIVAVLMLGDPLSHMSWSPLIAGGV